MDIVKYICNYLSENPDIIIPNLGRFVAIDKPAEIQGSIVIPPVKTVEFDSSVDVDSEEKLVSYIAQQEHANKEDVRQAIKDYYDTNIKIPLSSGQPVELSGLGILKVNDFGNILFAPDKDLKINRQDTYGLGAVNLSPETKTEPKIEATPVVDTVASTQEGESLFASEKMRVRENTERRSQPAIEKIQPPSETPNPAYVKPKPPQKAKAVSSNSGSSLWILWVLLGAVALGVGGYFLYPMLTHKTEPVATVEPEPTTISADVSNSSPENISESQQEQQSGKQEVQSTTKQKPPVVISSSGNIGTSKFLVIVGSFTSQARAEKYGSLLQQAGINYEIIDFGNNKVRVVVAGYNNVHEAYNQMNRIKTQPHCEGAWVLQR